jgi:catechol 2,3-dioxygenase-like lactoylglutathione lyase family enzyme
MPSQITAVHPVLMARDVTVSLAFYARLGFAPAFLDDPASPRYAGVRRGLVELHLQWADPTQWAHAGDRPAYRFLTSDVDALHAELLAAGALGRGASESPAAAGPWATPADTPWGTREFHVRDPGGNVLQFYRLRAAAGAPAA